MVTGTFAFLFGLCCFFWLAPPVPGWAVCALPLSVWLIRRYRRWRILFAFIAGVLYASLWFVTHPPLPPGDHTIVGQVDSIPETGGRRTAFFFTVHEPSSSWFRSRLRLSWYGNPDVLPEPGDVWRLRVRLKVPRGARNDGGFDYEGWLARRHVLRTGYVLDGRENQRLRRAPPWSVDGLRLRLVRELGRFWADRPVTAALSQALVTGERGGMDESQWRVLRATGTAHLLAISGLHMMLMASMGALPVWLWFRFWRPGPGSRPVRRWTALAGLLVATGYAALAGFSLPTQRALIMLIFCAAAIWMGRPFFRSGALIHALLLVLLWDPLAPAGADLWLSFGAVASLTMFFATRLRGPPQEERPVSPIDWLASQWPVLLGTLPLLAICFGEVSLISLPVNILAIPWLSLLVLPLTLIGSLLLPLFPLLASPVLTLAGFFLDGLWSVLELCASWPYALWPVAGPSWWLCVLAVTGSVMLLMPRGLLPRVLGISCLLALVWPAADRPVDGELRVTMLDVGQGLSVVVQTRNRLLLYDTGPAGNTSAAQKVVLPFLRTRGLRRVDRLVVSHSDNDHAGGVPDLLSAIAVGDMYSGTPQQLPGAVICQAGDSWWWDGVYFEFLHPLPDTADPPITVPACCASSTRSTSFC